MFHRFVVAATAVGLAQAIQQGNELAITVTAILLVWWVVDGDAFA